MTIPPEVVPGTPGTINDRGGRDDCAPPTPPALEAGGDGVPQEQRFAAVIVETKGDTIEKVLSVVGPFPWRESATHAAQAEVRRHVPSHPDTDIEFDLVRMPVGAGFSLDLVVHLHRQRHFSLETFGPGQRTAGVLDHIRKELLEIEAAPNDLAEWIDVAILAFDGAWRTGASPEQIVRALLDKQLKNEARKWPDWRTADPSKAIEHERGTA